MNKIYKSIMGVVGGGLIYVASMGVLGANPQSINDVIKPREELHYEVDNKDKKGMRLLQGKKIECIECEEMQRILRGEKPKINGCESAFVNPEFPNIHPGVIDPAPSYDLEKLMGQQISCSPMPDDTDHKCPLCVPGEKPNLYTINKNIEDKIRESVSNRIDLSGVIDCWPEPPEPFPNPKPWAPLPLPSDPSPHNPYQPIPFGMESNFTNIDYVSVGLGDNNFISILKSDFSDYQKDLASQFICSGESEPFKMPKDAPGSGPTPSQDRDRVRDQNRDRDRERHEKKENK